jgi:endo-1,4-beta-xylanase
MALVKVILASGFCALASAIPAPQWGDYSSAPAPVSSSATTSVSAPPTSAYSDTYGPTNGPYLNDLAHAAGLKYFGSATDQPGTGEYTDYVYQLILNDTRIFGQVTPANDMKYFATEPDQNNFTYSGGQVTVDIAEDHGKYLRCHNLIWSNQLPDWVINGTWTRDTLIEVMRNHITNLVTHWADVCYAWDVVNEAIASNGTWSSSIWYDTIGEDYFYLAFQFAGEAADATGKDIKLYYNDYGIESSNNKSAALINTILPEFKSRGIRIDGIGLESHYVVGSGTPNYTDQVATQQAYGALGVEVAVTELDVRFEDATNARTNTSGLALQAQNYYDSVKACVDSGPCIGVTVWDFDDHYSWIPSTFAPAGAADLYWEDFTRKPAYQAAAEALQGVPCSVCG